jgi:predicted AlkP superfamily phosphohydrolase/phosphomutase
MHDHATEPTDGTGSDRAFVLGLDGVPWDLLERWAAEGELPNVARLFEEGATGPLASTTPATTALAWPSLATGVGPDRHGLYGFRRLERDYSHRMNTADDWAVPALWDLLSPAVVGNVPMTYPAREIDGELVTGMMTPTLDERATHPSELAAEIRETIPEYRIGLQWSDYDNRSDSLIRDLESVVEARRALLDRLLERDDWRLCFFVFTAPDRLQHLVWEEERILDHYRILDEIIGEVLDHVAERDATLFVVSDHGFGPVSRVVNVNTVLSEAGYLTPAADEGTRGALARLGVGKRSVRDALARVGIDESTVLNLLPRSLVNRVAGAVPGDHVLFDVDYERTRAFCYGPGLVYVNDTERFAGGTVDPDHRAAVREEVGAVLRAVRDPETGDRVVRVHDGTELFPEDPAAPDLVARGIGDYHTDTALTPTVFTDPGTLNATHRPEGIALAWGPDIEAGADIADASVIDLAPTLLHTIGEAVPEHVDGQVWDVFDPDSEPAGRAVERTGAGGWTDGDGAEADGSDPDSPDAGGVSEPGDGDRAENDEVAERLRGLGYLD